MLKMFRKRIKNEKGFTLVELLVVIAIIGILAAVVAPTVFGQIEKGKVSSTIADYRAIKTALQMYNANTSNWPATQAAITTEYLEKFPGKNAWDGTISYTMSTASTGQVSAAGINAANFKYLTLDGVSIEGIKKIQKDLDGVNTYTENTVKDNGTVRYAAIPASNNSGTIYLILFAP